MQDEDETHSPNSHHLSESQEIVVGNAGRAILLGDELVDLESVHGRSAPYLAARKRGACPIWLQSSSPRMKAILGMVSIALLAFVAVLITGVTHLSDNTGSTGSGSSLQSDMNVVTNSLERTHAPTPRRSPSPTATKSSNGSSSTTPNKSVSAVNILLPDSLESKVPNFAGGGLSANEQHNWDIIKERIENTILQAFSDRLPEGYSLESVQIEKIDGYDTTSLRKRRKNTRQLQSNSDGSSQTSAVHAVLYASSVTVDCASSDCSTAADTVAKITTELSQLEFLEVEDVTETNAPVGSRTPTQSPITSSLSSLAPTTLAPSVLITKEPSSGSPTQAATNVTEGPLPLSIRQEYCSLDSLCGRCEGECSGDETCGEGLLCFIRMGYEYITGCLGPGYPGRSYCYDPLSEGFADILASDQICDRKSPCEKCRGGCYADEDCATNLFCFGRGGYETVPGCAGQGTFGTDYCFDPNDIQDF